MVGGYEALVDAFAGRVKGNIETRWRVEGVKREGDQWVVVNDRDDVRKYDELVSTLPIHELLKVWPEAPQGAGAE